jgi:CDGSH-type Zn-finger protein
MDKPKIFRKLTGPIRIEGNVDLTDHEGNPIPHPPAFSLCGCGLSKRMPFCDSTHKNPEGTNSTR